ncbi:tocopherol cyclase family protein [Enterococcus sp. AZ109]|uniref:tocopherol cyclase family protein n=1 Tax=Enterococcus sp. AZ109 TaxID=2774634 RepID=UPI003F28B87A
MAITTDIYYHGEKKQQSFFEGWYLKHQIDQHTYAFIPGISLEKDGSRQPFIQIIHDENSHMIQFDESEFFAEADRFYVRIGNNVFSEEGILLDIQDEQENLSISGQITYGPWAPIQRSKFSPSIMGPFSYLSFMECYHGILSMTHSLQGNLNWNGQAIDFSSGTGYIEKDWGTSFPKAYIWSQSNEFQQQDVQFFFSLADIPFVGFEFLGLICVVVIDGKEYRIATYHGGKVESITREKGQLVIRLKQKNLVLELAVDSQAGHELMAPSQGAMNRIIRENANTNLSIRLYERGKTIFEGEGRMAGFEEVGQVSSFNY